MNYAAPELDGPVSRSALQALAEQGARALQVTMAELCGPRGNFDLANRRIILMYWLRLYKRAKTQAIAEVLGRKAHAGVLFGVAKARRELVGRNRAYWQLLLEQLLKIKGGKQRK